MQDLTPSLLVPTSALGILRRLPEKFLACSYFLFTLLLHTIIGHDSLFALWQTLVYIRLLYGSYEFVEVLMSVRYFLQGNRATLTSPNSDIVDDSKMYAGGAASLPQLHVIIVAYLPNERDIILEHTTQALANIIYPPELLRVHVAFNTPVPIPDIEDALFELEKEKACLNVHRVPKSSSKAANVNYVLDRLPDSGIVAIFDTDHLIEPHSPLRAVRRLMADPSISALQGRCIPRNVDASLLCRLIAVEFDILYAITHLGRDLLWDTAMFNGSNGYWRLETLKKLRLDHGMMAEDIDLSFRAIADGHVIIHDPAIISYELAPETWSRFWGQRLRWAHGWTQASWKHRNLVLGRGAKGKLKGMQRLGLVVLLLLREVSTHVQLQYFLASLVLLLRQVQSPESTDAAMFFAGDKGALMLSALFHTVGFIAIIKVSSPYVTWRARLGFFCISPIHSFLMSLSGLFGQIRLITAYNIWKPTPR